MSIKIDNFRTTVEEGNYYLVSPCNPMKKKHRGRICKILSLGFLDNKAVVLFLNTKKKGKVEVSDLIDFEDDIDI